MYQSTLTKDLSLRGNAAKFVSLLLNDDQDIKNWLSVYKDLQDEGKMDWLYTTQCVNCEEDNSNLLTKVGL